jgi:hypothetical protein
MGDWGYVTCLLILNIDYLLDLALLSWSWKLSFHRIRLV